MRHAVPCEIRDALGMPGADMAQACERIRTLRHTEQLAGEVLAGRLRRRQAPEETSLDSSTGQTGWAVRVALVAAAAVLVLALLLGWAAMVDQPQGETWMQRLQSGGHPHADVELLLRAARRERASRND